MPQSCIHFSYREPVVLNQTIVVVSRSSSFQILICISLPFIFYIIPNFTYQVLIQPLFCFSFLIQRVSYLVLTNCYLVFFQFKIAFGVFGVGEWVLSSFDRMKCLIDNSKVFSFWRQFQQRCFLSVSVYQFFNILTYAY